MNYKTKGIVIKRTNLGEADKILTILTERFGKVKAIAKGVRKVSSKLCGDLEPFMLLDLQLYEGKTFFTVTGSLIIEEFYSIHSDLKKMSEMFYLGELIDKFSEENQKNEEIFQLFIAALNQIETQKDSFWLRVFELKLIEASGFHPELYECVYCRNKLKLGENFWDSIEGGCICLDCQQKNQRGKKINDELIKLLRFIEKNSFAGTEKLKKSKKLEDETENILKDYIESILEREIKSQKFLKKCIND